MAEKSLKLQPYEMIRIFKLDKYGKLKDGAEYYVVVPRENEHYTFRLKLQNGEILRFRKLTNNFGFNAQYCLDGLVLRTFDTIPTEKKNEHYSREVFEDYKYIRLITINSTPKMPK